MLNGRESKRKYYIRKNIIEDSYSTVSAFSLALLGLFREKYYNINPHDFLTLFNLLKEYEDDNIKVPMMKVVK